MNKINFNFFSETLKIMISFFDSITALHVIMVINNCKCLEIVMRSKLRQNYHGITVGQFAYSHVS